MTLQMELVLGLAITCVCSILFGGLFRRLPLTLRSFFWADSKLKPDQTAQLLLSSSFSINGVLYQTWIGYKIGWACLWIQFAWCLGFIVVSVLGPRLKSRVHTLNTLHGCIGETYSVSALRLAALASIIGFTLQVGWEIAVGVGVFSSAIASQQSFVWFLTIGLAIAAAIYTMLGGLGGNLRANIFQNQFAALAFMMLVVVVIVKAPATGGGAAIERFSDSHGLLLTALGLGGIISNFVFSLSWHMVDMSVWQNLEATERTVNAPRRALYKSAGIVFLFPGLCGAIAGVYLHRIQLDLTDVQLLPFAIKLLADYPILAVFIFAGLVAAMLSTIDGLLLACAQSLTWDLTDRKAVRDILQSQQPQSNAAGSFGPPPNARDALSPTGAAESPGGQRTATQERRILWKARSAVLLLALAGATVVAGVMHLGVSLFNIVYLVVLAQMALVPVVLTMLLAKRSLSNVPAAWSVFSGLIAGFALFGAGLAFPEVKFLGSGILDNAPFVTVIIAAVPIVGGLIKKAPKIPDVSKG